MDTSSDIAVVVAGQSLLVRTWHHETRLLVLRGELTADMVGQEVRGMGLPAGTKLACASSNTEGVLSTASTLMPIGAYTIADLARFNA